MSLSAVVQHLAVLEASGLVRSAKTGRVRTCQIEPKALRAAEQWIADRRMIWERRLDRLGEYLAEHQEDPIKGEGEMTERSINHSTIVLERIYDASPARVFSAWSDPNALLRWGSPGEGWHSEIQKFDFRVGGGEVSSFGPAGGETYVNETRYLDIVPNVRIISAGAMTSDGKRLFAGLLTVELKPRRQGLPAGADRAGRLPRRSRPSGEPRGRLERDARQSRRGSARQQGRLTRCC